MAMIRHAGVARLLGAVLALQVLYAGATMGVTCDECGHFGGGIFLWDYSRFDVYRVNPPLVRAIAGAPAALFGLKREYRSYNEGPAVRVEWRMGQDMIAANPSTWEWYFVWGRWAVLPFVLVGAYFVYRWTCELYGTTGGLIALALWCFCPNVVAWGATFTPDAAAASMGVAAGFSFWKWLREPTWRRALEAGLWLAIAELTKCSWIILFPLWPLLWAFWRVTSSQISDAGSTDIQAERDLASAGGCPEDSVDVNASVLVPQAVAQATFGQLGSILLFAVYLINAGYGFEGSFTPLKDFVFVSGTLAGKDSTLYHQPGGNRFKDSWLGSLPIPVPYNYLRGIDLQKVDFERGMPSYLNGEWSKRGWWYYYIVAATLKVPLATWLLGMIVLAMKCSVPRGEPACAKTQARSRGRATWRDEVILLAPAIVLFALVSSQTGFSRYFRYVLPCFPFVYVWIGQTGRLLCVRRGDPAAARENWIPAFAGMTTRNGRLLQSLTVGSLVWFIVSSLSVFPFSMSYFNELAGGPRNGHRYLLESNIDWAQDMFHLRNWLRKHPEAQPIGMSYCCFVPPKDYGIKATVVPSEPMPGWFAMSLQRIYEGDRYTFFLKYKPVATAGYSIYIYHVSLDEANRVRRELDLPLLEVDPPAIHQM